MFILSFLSFPHLDVFFNYLPQLLAQGQKIIFPIHNFSDKATIYLKSLQTEMMAIWKASFVFLPVFSKSMDRPFCAVSELAGLDFYLTSHSSIFSVTEVLIATSKYYRFGWLFLLIKDRVSLRWWCLLCEGHTRGKTKTRRGNFRKRWEKPISISFLMFFVLPFFITYTWKNWAFFPPAPYKLQWNVPRIQGEWPFARLVVSPGHVRKCRGRG